MTAASTPAARRSLGRFLAVRGERAWPGALRLGVAILAVAFAFALVGPAFLPDPSAQDLETAYLGPGSAGHPLGTDPLGRDVLAWIAAGIRTAGVIGLAVVTLSALIGLVIGLVAGYAGGLVDSVLMRLVDLQLAIPPLLLFITAAAVLGTDPLTLIVLLSVASWVPYARVVRAQVQIERERASIVAARLAGLGVGRVLVRHLLPATASTVVVLASLQLGFVLLWESALSFVGLGVQPPSHSLGFLIAQGRDALVEAWWVVVFPGLALMALVLAGNLVGDGLRDRLDVDAELFDR